MDEQELRELIRLRICSGTLPLCSDPHTLFGGNGEGGECDCCGQQIVAAQIQFDVDCCGDTFQMHLRCYDAWRKKWASDESSAVAG